MKNNIQQEGVIIRRDFPKTVFISKYPDLPKPTSKSDLLEVPSRPTITNIAYAGKTKTKGNLGMRLTNVLTYRWAVLDILENGNRSIMLPKSDLYRQVISLYPPAEDHLTESMFKTYIAPCTRYKCVFTQRKIIGRSEVTGKRLFKVIGSHYRFLAVSDLKYGMEFQMSMWMPWMRSMVPGFVTEREFTSELMDEELELMGDPDFMIESLNEDYFFIGEEEMMAKLGEILMSDKQKSLDMSPDAVRKRARSAELRRYSRERRRRNGF